jgi:general secretion pathway protein I
MRCGSIGCRGASRSCCREAGFTLLETLVALVILSFALTALYNSTGTSARAIRASGAHMEARLLAETMLAEVASLRAPKPGTTSGSYKQFRWHTNIAPAVGDWVPPTKDTPFVPYHVTVTVEWPVGRRFVLQTVHLRARPKS